MAEAWAWIALLVSAAVTYLPRGLGVALSGRIRPDGPVMRWISAVAYALLAGLVARMIVLPIGPLQQTWLPHRLAAAGVALLVFLLAGRNMLLAVAAGLAALVLLSAQ